VASVYSALAGAHPALKVYRREDLPPRFHLAGSPRTAPIIAVPALGWTVSTHERAERSPRSLSGGAHGYDNEARDMHSVFLAAGPAFRSGARVDTMRAVDVYDVIARSLSLHPAQNDGDPSVVSRLMTQ
jgi:Type I phosphodiesterase / nucleotide pyrophosphatase